MGPEFAPSGDAFSTSPRSATSDNAHDLLMSGRGAGVGCRPARDVLDLEFCLSNRVQTSRASELIGLEPLGISLRHASQANRSVPGPRSIDDQGLKTTPRQSGGGAHSLRPITFNRFQHSCLSKLEYFVWSHGCGLPCNAATVALCRETKRTEVVQPLSLGLLKPTCIR